MRRRLDYLDEDTWGTVFRNVILLALIGFVAMVIMLLSHITTKKQEAEDHKAPCKVPVGFWNLGGTTFNLLRDDLGGEDDATNENYEISYSRGSPPGEYVVNVHMYGPLPYGVTNPVNVVVSVKPKYGDVRQLLETTINLTRRNQEETAYRFRLTAEGELVPDSVSTPNRPLITVFKGFKKLP